MLSSFNFRLTGNWTIFFVYSLFAILPCSLGAAANGIFFETVKPSREYPTASVPGALQYACGKDEMQVEKFFTAQSVPFNRELVRKKKGQFCHIFYRPTLPGFQAHAESDPVTQMVFGVESRGFLAGRTRELGDSLDVAKLIAKSVPESICLTVATRAEVSESWTDKAVRNHFAERLCPVSTLPHQAVRDNVWARDYVLSGEVQGRNVALLPWMTFENQAENGEMLTPVLDALESASWVRSKLSWEGGDLLIARHPANPNKSILFYGDSAQPYWAKSLSDEEYAHVLKVEFGADDAVPAGGIATHIDYVLNFLPDGHTVLMAKPLHGDIALGRSALQLLSKAHPGVPLLAEIDEHYPQRRSPDFEERDKALALLEQAAKEVSGWPRLVDLGTSAQAESYAREHCGGNPQACLTGDGFERLLENNPKLAETWIQAMGDLRLQELASRALIGIASSQLVTPGGAVEQSLRRLKRRLQDMGFRVVDTPHIDGMPGSIASWAGISYTNFIAVENKIFMPVFGLGMAEERILMQLQSRMPEPFHIVPVYARHILASNGGVHCVTGVLRTKRTGQGYRELGPRSQITPPVFEDAVSMSTETRE